MKKNPKTLEYISKHYTLGVGGGDIQKPRNPIQSQHWEVNNLIFIEHKVCVVVVGEI